MSARATPRLSNTGSSASGLNDYPAMLSKLSAAGFCGWISIEDGEAQGEQGFADIAASARYLAGLVDGYW